MSTEQSSASRQHGPRIAMRDALIHLSTLPQSSRKERAESVRIAAAAAGVSVCNVYKYAPNGSKTLREKVLAKFKKGVEIHGGDVAKLLADAGANPASVGVAIYRLAESGELKRVRHGVYVLAKRNVK